MKKVAKKSGQTLLLSKHNMKFKAFLAKGVSAKILKCYLHMIMNFRLGKLKLNKFRLGYLTLSWFRIG